MRVAKRLVFTALLAGCMDPGGPDISVSRNPVELRVERVEAEGDVPNSGISAVGGRLIGYLGHDTVVTSEDDGATWRRVPLPGQPVELDLTVRSPIRDRPFVARGAAVLAGVDVAPRHPTLPVTPSEVHLWTSIDGARWAHHVLATTGQVSGQPHVTSAGAAVVVEIDSLDGHNLFTSSDRGATWQAGSISGVADGAIRQVSITGAWTAGDDPVIAFRSDAGRTEGRTFEARSNDAGRTWIARPLEVPPSLSHDRILRAGGLLMAGGNASTDDGETWHEVDLEPGRDPPRDGGFLRTLTKVPGGWLGTASPTWPEDGQGGGARLVRSPDGRRWTEVLPVDRCRNAGGFTWSVDGPAHVGDRWYVSYHCSGVAGSRGSRLYASTDVGGTTFAPVAGTDRGSGSFGTPVAAGDRVVVPERGRNGELAVTTVRE